MIYRLSVLSGHHALERGSFSPHYQPVFGENLRFGNKGYDSFDRRVQTARTLPDKLDALTERFIATTLPDLSLNRIEDLTPKTLRGLGHIRAVIFDLDDTLMPILSGKFPEPVLKALKCLHQEGFKLGVVTNNIQPAYCQNARELLRQEGLEIPFVEDARKPDPAGFLAMQEHLGVKPSQVAVVGDGYLCDVRCANLLGMKTIQAGWFTEGKLATTTSYAVDTVVAMLQTLRGFLSTPARPSIISSDMDGQNAPSTKNARNTRLA